MSLPRGQVVSSLAQEEENSKYEEGRLKTAWCLVFDTSSISMIRAVAGGKKEIRSKGPYIYTKARGKEWSSLTEKHDQVNIF